MITETEGVIAGIQQDTYCVSQYLFAACGQGYDKARREYDEWQYTMGYRAGLGAVRLPADIQGAMLYRRGYEAAILDTLRVSL